MNAAPRQPARPTAPAAAAVDASPTAGPTTTDGSFEESLLELERIVRCLERGELGLADSLTQYEQGVRHLQKCYAQLEQAERRVELLKSVSADGQIKTESFAEQAMSLDEKAAARGARRTAAGRASPGPGDAVDDSAGLF